MNAITYNDINEIPLFLANYRFIVQLYVKHDDHDT